MRIHIGIRTQLLVSFLVVIMIPLLFLGILVPLMSTRSITHQSEISTAQILSRTVKSLDLAIRSIENTADLVLRDPATASFLSASMTKSGNSQKIGIIDSVCSIHPEITGILIANTINDTLTGDFVRITRDALRNEAWFLDASIKPGTLTVITRPVGRNIRNTRRSDVTQVATFVKAISSDSGEIVGAVMVDVNLSYFDNILSDAALATDGFVLVLDAHSGVVYAPANRTAFRIKPDMLAVSGERTEARIHNEQFRILYEGSAETGWKVVGVFSLQKLLSEINILILMGLIIGLVSLVIAFMLSFAFSYNLARPIINLKQLMKQVEIGDLSVRFSSSGSREIIELGNGFNTMVEEIGKLIEIVYQEQQKKREAELKVLQAQIKPHFLYNTLDTIQWMAKEKGAGEIVHLVSALTSLFRIGLSRGKETISVAEEIEHVKSYLVIQKIRYGDKFDFFMDIDENVLKLLTIKLILQPVVENAIYHGVKEKSGHGTILLSVHTFDGMIVFEVQDDGAGISEEKLEKIRMDFTSLEPPGENGYGLYNINQRIRLTSGYAHGVTVESSSTTGTMVTITHPLIQEI